MNMLFKRKLPTPQEVKDMYPLSNNSKRQKAKNDKEIQSALTEKNGKFLLIIGPCSADREDSVLEYLTRLAVIREKVSDKIVLLPRIYTNKPRTTGIGYKGMLHQSNPRLAPNMFQGIIASRRMHLHCLEQTGFSGADELLYPETYRYFEDTLSYVAIGARSTENQQHRLTASGLDIPVGFKNPTSGDLSIMLHAIKSAQCGHDFAYGEWEVQSRGNRLAHAILRGYTNISGEEKSNYSHHDLIDLCKLCDNFSISNPAVIVDVNHSNSKKIATEQPKIAKDVLQSIHRDKTILALVKGLMIESYLVDGSQMINGKTYGQSITDPCLGWEKSERLIYDIADMV